MTAVDRAATERWGRRMTATVVIGVSEEVATLDPQARELFIIGAVTDWNIYEALLQRNTEGELEPLLAASLPTQVDDTTWQVELRDDVEFTNGEPFNAEAAAYSINRIIDPDFASEKLPRLTGIVSAEAVDDYTVEIKTAAADPILPSRIELIMMVPPEYAETADFAKAPIGTGPYLWKSGVGRGPVVLEANPDYWGDSTDGLIQNVEYRVIPDAATRISAVQAGEVDLIMDCQRRLGRRHSRRCLPVTSLENNLVTLNSRDGITSDVRVRQALNYAIDKDAMAEDLWSGYASPAKCQAVAPDSPSGTTTRSRPTRTTPTRPRTCWTRRASTGESITLVGQAQIFPRGPGDGAGHRRLLGGRRTQGRPADARDRPLSRQPVRRGRRTAPTASTSRPPPSWATQQASSTVSTSPTPTSLPTPTRMSMRWPSRLRVSSTRRPGRASRRPLVDRLRRCCARVPAQQRQDLRSERQPGVDAARRREDHLSAR